MFGKKAKFKSYDVLNYHVSPMILLRGERIHLRPLEPSDLKEFFRWINDAEAAGEFDVFGITSWADLEKWTREPSGPYEFSALVIERNSTKDKVGVAVRYISHPVMCHMEVGFQIWDKNERNKGYATEAARLLVDYLFTTRDLTRVQATTHVLNKPAQRVLEKCGFAREGRLKSALFTNGEHHDAYVYGITRRKWKLLRNNGNHLNSESPSTIISPMM